ncbi:uncharacterized protein [Clytia hemisphaerica]
MNKLVLLLLGVSCALIAFTNARAIEEDSEDLAELRERRQLPPPPPGGNGGNGVDPQKELLEKLLLEKLNFITRLGLLKGIPFLGQLVHDLVEKDPEGVSKALSGGIFAILGHVLKSGLVG